MLKQTEFNIPSTHVALNVTLWLVIGGDVGEL